jgi:hypothetical protein
MKTDERVKALFALETLARWLAKEAVTQRYRERGRYRIDPVELARATNAYLSENRARLREEARAILNQV